MTANSVLALARVAALALMQDACTITRRTTQTTDPETGVITQNYSTLYTGQCKVQRRGPRGQSNRPHDFGGDFEFVSYTEVAIPVSSTTYKPDDIVTVTASVNDADLVGRVFHLRGFEHKSFPSARRLMCLEVTG